MFIAYHHHHCYRIPTTINHHPKLPKTTKINTNPKLPNQPKTTTKKEKEKENLRWIWSIISPNHNPKIGWSTQIHPSLLFDLGFWLSLMTILRVKSEMSKQKLQKTEHNYHQWNTHIASRLSFGVNVLTLCLVAHVM